MPSYLPSALPLSRPTPQADVACSPRHHPRLRLWALAGAMALACLSAGPALAIPGAPTFEAWDQNKDGRVTFSEFRVAMVAQFKQVDKNQDKIVTVDEALDMLPALVRGMAKPKVEEYIRWQDSNRDGKLSLAEVLAYCQTRFKNIDTNHDGYISQAEFDHRPLPGR